MSACNVHDIILQVRPSQDFTPYEQYRVHRIDRTECNTPPAWQYVNPAVPVGLLVHSACPFFLIMGAGKLLS